VVVAVAPQAAVVVLVDLELVQVLQLPQDHH
jgi:hypothetical protein